MSVVVRKAYIYALSDPRNRTIPKYIGQTTVSLRRRLWGHFSFVKQRPNYPVHKWIAALRSENLVPVIFALEETDTDNASLRETHWIRFFRPLGSLLNQSDGPGMLGMKHPLPREVIDRQAASKRGKKMKPERKEHWLNHPNNIIGRQKLAAYNAEKSRPVVCNDGRTFASINAAAKAIGRDGATLGKAMKEGWMCNGFRFSFLERT